MSELTGLLDRLFRVSKRDNCDRYYLFSCLGFALFLHRIHTDEEEGVYHNHPWNGISLILGSYVEERLGDRKRKRRWLHYLPARQHHRLELPHGPVWTLFLHFRRSSQWTVVNKDGTVLATEPWRAVGGETSYSPMRPPWPVGYNYKGLKVVAELGRDYEPGFEVWGYRLEDGSQVFVRPDGGVDSHMPAYVDPGCRPDPHPVPHHWLLENP